MQLNYHVAVSYGEPSLFLEADLRYGTKLQLTLAPDEARALHKVLGSVLDAYARGEKSAHDWSSRSGPA